MKDTHTRISERQKAILEFLSRNGESSISEITTYIREHINNVSKLTVGRDIKKLICDEYITHNGAGRSVTYSLSAKYRVTLPIDVDRYFSIPQDDRHIIKQFNYDIFNTLNESIFTDTEINKLDSLHTTFLAKLKKIDSTTLIAKEFERIIIEFSWKSASIEGNTYSLLDTEILIKENKKAEGKTDEETMMILNHKEAFEYILKNKNDFKILSKINIEYVHRLLTKGLHIPENLRKAPVGITGTNYKPIDNIFQIEDALDKMLILINGKKSFFEKSFLCLALLSYIQPFEDGNKRTARTISNAILLAHDTAPISYRAVNEVEYKKATLLFYEINNLFYFKDIFLKQYEFAVENYF